MILRSLKLVHFRGVAEFELREPPIDAVASVALPPDAPRSLLRDALRFAFLGSAPGDAAVVSPGAGYAYVEVRFRLGQDAHLSIFRGVDRRGAAQVSLREDGAMRVTGGEAEVRTRLEDLVGVPLDRWEYATFVDPPGIADPLADLTGLAPLAELAAAVPAGASLPVPAADGLPSLDAAREQLDRDVDSLRRALRASALARRIDEDFGALVLVGQRLRRERADASVRADRAAADRERARTRLRRVNEYRDQITAARAQAEAEQTKAATTRGRPSAAVEVGLGACAVVLLLVLLLVASGRAGSLQPSYDMQVVLGLGFLFAFTSYLGVATRRRAGDGRFLIGVAEPPSSSTSSSTSTSPPADAEWRESLRHRFADLGDPDDPELVRDLRTRLAALDDELAPLQGRLERLDEAIAACDIETGRASRAMHRLPPEVSEAERGLDAGETLDDVRTRVASLGDAVFHACVERDALRAGGTDTVSGAVAAVRGAFRSVGEAVGRPDAGDAILAREGLAVDAGAVAGAGLDDDALYDKRLDDDACARLLDAADALAREPAAPAAAATAEALVALLAQEALRDAEKRAGAALARLASPLLPSVSGGRFDGVEVGPGLSLRLRVSGGESVPWAAVPDDTRSRIAWALRLRVGEAAATAAEGLVTPERRVVVLDARPEGFADDAALMEFVRLAAPSVAQLLVPVEAAGTPRTASHAATQPVVLPEGAGPASPPSRHRRRRPSGPGARPE